MTDPLRDRVIAAIGQHYDLDAEIGRGGMSVVYRAVDRRLNRPVAVKVLPPELAYDPAIRTRFTREALTSARLSHAHIVPIYDVGEGEGLAYFVMALITGGNLAELLAREPRQPIEEVRRLVAEIADALAYAHLHAVIHRDIKPDNILLDAHNGRAMVSDFGIARAVEAGTRLTLTGVAVGTPTYMSPEQAVGDREIDGRSDIYSLGVLAYQMLTGRVPFIGGNSAVLLLKHVNERPAPLSELRPDTPPPLREAIERAMLKAPEDRWPTAAAMRQAVLSDDLAAGAWRADQLRPVRYTSPRPDTQKRDGRAISPRRGTPARPAGANAALSPRSPNDPALEPDYAAALTPAQRDDLRLWHGRLNLVERIRFTRYYTLYTATMWVAGVSGFVVGAAEFIPPLWFAPLVPIWISGRLRRRARSLRESGIKLRRVFLKLRSRNVLPQTAPTPPSDKQLRKLASREILDGPFGSAIRRAAEERSAIMGIVASLSKEDRALLPEIEPAVKGLLDRVVHLAKTIHKLDQSVDPNLTRDLDARIAEMEPAGNDPDAARHLTALRRQRATLQDIVSRRATLSRQIENAVIALGTLRLDLIKFRSSGLQSALSDVSMATQEARALSREIGTALEAAAEVKSI
jgi:serine/threonine-protein kinase